MRRKLLECLGIVALVLVVSIGSFALADEGQETKKSEQSEVEAEWQAQEPGQERDQNDELRISPLVRAMGGRVVGLSSLTIHLVLR